MTSPRNRTAFAGVRREFSPLKPGFDLERWSQLGLAAIQAVLLICIVAYLLWMRALARIDLAFLLALIGVLILARLNKVPYRLAAPILVLAGGGLLLGATRSWHYVANSPSEYVGLQKDASYFTHALYGNTVVYGGEPVLEGARLLTDRAFINSMQLKRIDGAADGVSSALAADQLRRVMGTYERTDFWIGGYHHVLFSDRRRAGSDDTYYFFLTPPDWRNAILVLPDSIYQEIK